MAPSPVWSAPPPPDSIAQTACGSVQPLSQGSRLYPTDRQTDRQTHHATSPATGRVSLHWKHRSVLAVSRHEPCCPANPGVPDDPVNPSRPLLPTTPLRPVAPVNPVAPVAPSTPVKPNTPPNPGTPVQQQAHTDVTVEGR